MSVEEKKILKNIKEYTPAKSRESIKRKYGIEHLVKLAGNENRMGCSKKATWALKEFIENDEEIFLYPDGNVTVLRELLAEKHGVENEELIFGNGSFEIIEIIAKTYLEQADEAIISIPSFSWYENVTKQAGAIPVKVKSKNFETDLDAINKAITDKTKIIWICNPNNPTGTLIDSVELEKFIDNVRNDILIVLDEAYMDFVTGKYINSAELIKRYDNVIALRTFSKLYGLAGFRIGYGYADKKIISSLLKSKTPINVSAVAQVAAIASIKDEEFKDKVIKNNRDCLERMYSFLNKAGLRYVKSHTNFILFDTGMDSKLVTEKFLEKGILIRGGSEYGFDTYVRITIGTKDDTDKVIDILEELLEEGGKNHA